MIALDQLNFVGYNISDGEIKPNMEKVKAIQNAKPPKTEKQVRSFLGMVWISSKIYSKFFAVSSFTY
jgi:hypothetical protein